MKRNRFSGQQMISGIVILPPFFQRFAGIGQRTEKRLVQTFVPQLAVIAFDKAVLLGVRGCDVMPIEPSILNPFEDSHAGELGAVVPLSCAWLAAFCGEPIQLACNAETRHRSISQQHQVLTAEVVDNREDAKTVSISQRISYEI